MPKGLERYVITAHTADSISDRRIAMAEVELTLKEPEQVFSSHSDRTVYQRRFNSTGGKVYMIRAIVTEHWDPPEVITVYRTTQLRRYWRKDE